MRILAIDLGKSKSVACDFDSGTGESSFVRLNSTPEAFHDLLLEHDPDRVVFEIGTTAGWVYDLCSQIVSDVQVANPTHRGWQWRHNKRKSDRIDALKLAQLAAINQVPLVHMPAVEVRHWRSHIQYRADLVGRRTQIRNHIRAMLQRVALTLPSAQRGWSRTQLVYLQSLTEDDNYDALWRSELASELRLMAATNESISQTEERLGELARKDQRVARLQTIPGVGPRLAEAVVAVLDDPHRFRNSKQVGSYAGLVPRQYQTGASDYQGRITKQGHRLLRALLVQASWVGIQHNPWAKTIYERVRRGSPSRTKIAIVAVARRLLIRCWVMLRDRSTWDELRIAKAA